MGDPKTPIPDDQIDSYFSNMELKHLMQQTQGVLNEYQSLVRKRVIHENDVYLLTEEVLGYEMHPHHEQILASQQSIKPAGKQMTLAFRGCGKSTVGTVSRAVYEIIKNPNIRILLASNTQIQAEIFLREIKEHFEGNEKLRTTFGDYVGKKWDAKEIIVSMRTKAWKESTLSCIGVGGPTASRHYDLIICDDIVDEENSRTELQREKLFVWFMKSLMPTLEPHARLFVSGTCYNPGDIYAHLRDTVNHLCVVPAINDRGDSNWPEKFSIDYLVERRAEMGVPIFETQFQMNTSAMEGKIFNYDSFHFYDGNVPSDHIKFQGCDLAIGQNKENDYFAHATIAVTPERLTYVVAIYQARKRFREQTAIIVKRFFLFDPIRVGIEANAYQAAQVHEVQEHIGKRRAIPVYTHKDKTTRGMKLAAKCENGEVLFNKNDPDQMRLIEQLIKMPGGDHDDMFDALDVAVTTSVQGIRKKRSNEPGVI